MGQLIGNTLLPIVNFFKNDFGNTLLLFGGILGLVFGKSLQIVSGFVGDVGRGLQTYADDLADKASLTEKQVGRINNAVKGAGIQARQLQGQDPKQFAQFKSALEAQRSGSVATASQLNRVNQAYATQIAELKRLDKTGTKSYAALKNAYESNRAELRKLNGATRGYLATSNLLNASLGLQTAIRGVLCSCCFSSWINSKSSFSLVLVRLS